MDNFEERGIDYDLRACIDNNSVPFELDDIKKVHAVHEGVRDEEDWVWVIELNSGIFINMVGWCDYTGWDCQSGVKCVPTFTIESAIDATSQYSKDREIAIKLELFEQLNSGKTKTWEENASDLFGNVELVDPPKEEE